MPQVTSLIINKGWDPLTLYTITVTMFSSTVFFINGAVFYYIYLSLSYNKNYQNEFYFVLYWNGAFPLLKFI